MINPQLGYTIAYGLGVTWVAQGQAADPDVDSRLRNAIAQRGKPRGVLRSLADFDHAQTVSHGILGWCAPEEIALPNVRDKLPAEAGTVSPG